MKMKVSISIAIAFLLLFLACKKNDIDIDDLTYFCSNARFQIIVPDSLSPVSITEDDFSNIIVLGIKGGQTVLLKLNPSGTVLWNKTFSAIPGTPSEEITLSDNSS